MSRSFSDSSTSNTVRNTAGATAGLSYKLNGAPAVTVLTWANIASLNGGTSVDNVIFTFPINGGTTYGVRLHISGSSLRTNWRTRSISTDGSIVRAGPAVVTTGIWQAHGGYSDFAAASPAMGCSLDGTVQTITQVFGATTYTHGTPTINDSIGSTDGGMLTTWFDGLIGPCAVWKAKLSNDEFFAHYRGVSPLLLRPMSLVSYVPMWGVHSPELDLINPGFSWVISGSVPANAEGPPVCLDELWMFRGTTASMMPAIGSTAKVGADALAVSLSEVRTLLASLLRSDNVTASLGEAASIFGFLDGRVDTPALSMGEVATILGKLSRSDTTGVSLVEASAVAAILSKADNPTVSLGEARTLFAVLARSDAASLTVGETRSIFVNVANRADTVSVAVGEARALATTLTRTDAPSLGITDAARTINATLNRADTAAVSAGDARRPIDVVVTKRTDAPTVGITEARLLAASIQLVNELVVGITEARSIAVAINRSDTAAAGVAEARTIKATLLRADTPAVAVAEARAILASLQRADAPTLSLSELSAIFRMIGLADSLGVGITDAARSMLVTLTRIDTPTVAISEARTIFAALARADTPGIGIAEVARLVSARSVSDALMAGVAETLAVLLARLARADAPTVQLVETARIIDLAPRAQRMKFKGRRDPKREFTGDY